MCATVVLDVGASCRSTSRRGSSLTYAPPLQPPPAHVRPPSKRAWWRATWALLAAGVVVGLIVGSAGAIASRYHMSEIRWRMQRARTYPTESQIGRALADFESWNALVVAGFPTYEPKLDEPLADHRSITERNRALAGRAAEAVGDQLSMFPLDRFEPVDTTLKQLVEYREEQDKLTARFLEHGRKRGEYLDAMLAAVEGDESRTWAEGHQAAFGQQL
jgi:hypothetical protein